MDPSAELVCELGFNPVVMHHFLNQWWRYLPVLQAQLETQSDVAIRVVRMDQVPESAEVDPVAAKVGPARVDVAAAEDLVRIAERVQDGALAAAVAPE